MSQPDAYQNPPGTGPYGGHPPAGGYPPPNIPHPTSAGADPTYPHAAPPPGGSPTPPGAFPPPPGQFQAPAGPPPKKKSNVGKIVLIVILALLVLCAGAGTAVWFAVKDTVGEAVDAAKTRVVAPDTLAGRSKATDPELQKASEEMVTDMRAATENETSAIGGFYGDPAGDDFLMVVAMSGLMTDPKKELDDTVQAYSGELSMRNTAAIDPGPLGGEAVCADGKAEEVPVGVCAWADRGSVGLYVMYGASRADAQAEFLTIRGQIEQRD